MVGLDVECEVGEVVAYVERGRMYVEAPYGAPREELTAVIEWVRELGWEPGPEHEDEETDTGLRIRCSRLYKPHNQKLIAGLLSIPLLMGMGAIMATTNYWLVGAVGAMA